MAASRAGLLVACGVSVGALGGLRRALYSHEGLDMSKEALRGELVPLACQQLSPERLVSLKRFLYNPPVDMTRADAGQHAKGLALQGVDVDTAELERLHAALYNSDGANLRKDQAAKQLVVLAAADADAEAFEAIVHATRPRTQAAVAEAVAEATVAGLGGVARRYAEDGWPYTAAEFRGSFGEAWLDAWLAAPRERCWAADGKVYTAAAFKAAHGAGWAAAWGRASEVVQRRIPKDSTDYASFSLWEFAQRSPRTWQEEWAQAFEPRDLRGSLDHLIDGAP